MLPHALPTFWFNLTLMRFREFWREPESMFWVLVFPILLAAGLGLAFGNRAPEILKVAAVTPELATSLRHEALLDVGQLTMAEGEVSLLAGKVALLVLPGPGGSVLYHYDESRPDGRTARMLADRAIQRAAGRLDPIAASDVIVVETGSRYIDFLVPGLVGMNIMNSAIWGVGYSI